ncbi:MAG: flagellar basal body-associated FliL family protein [Helicobacteraceae bacterium]|jgi:flagellar FliL protein|nr:flagellar basal body-associated FliL family protein [Helicobacteraceae bacterium]
MAEEPKTEKEEVKKKSPLILIAIGGIALVLIAVIGLVVLLLGSSGESAQPQRTSGAAATGGNAEALGPIVDLDQFIVNLLSAEGRRFLKARISFELTHKNAGAEIDNKMPRIRDSIISLLSAKRFDEISTESGKTRLREEIRSAVNRYLIDGQIKSVFFIEFVIQ